MTFAASCLRSPDLFPARVCGETWGAGRLMLSFPGGPYQVDGLSAEGEARLRARYGPLCSEDVVTETASPARIGLFRARADEFLPAPVPPSGLYQLEIDHGSRGVRLAGQAWMALLDTEAPLQAGVFTAEATPADFIGILENTLRVAAAYRLFDTGGVLLHSAGVVSNGKAYLFVGRSGAGKTTIARRSLAEGRQVLSDDLNAVVLDRGELRVRQVPFAGELGMTLSPAPLGDYLLAGVFGLAHLPKDDAPATVTAFSAAEALGLLVSAASGINGDPARQDGLMETLVRLLGRVRRGRVAFSLRGPVWSVLEGVAP